MECNTDSMKRSTTSRREKGLPATKRRRVEPFRGSRVNIVRPPQPPPLFAAANTNANERKFIDTATTHVITAGAITMNTGILLNACVQGTTATTRIGRKIRMKSIFIRAEARMNSLSTGGGDIRLLVIYDKQTNAALATSTDVLQANDFVSPNNLANKDRFVTIMDKYMHIDTNNFGCSAMWYKKIDLETMFNNGNAGTITDITTGSIIIFVGQMGGVLTNAAQLRTYSRIRYDD